MEIINHTRIGDDRIHDAYLYVLGVFIDLRCQITSRAFETVVVNRREPEQLGPWRGDANVAGQGFIRLWVDEDFVITRERKQTVMGDQAFWIVGMDALLRVALAHEMAHIYLGRGNEAHAFIHAFEVAVARSWHTLHGPSPFRTWWLMSKNRGKYAKTV